MSFEMPPFSQQLPFNVFKFCSGTPPRCLLGPLSASVDDNVKHGSSFFALVSEPGNYPGHSFLWRREDNGTVRLLDTSGENTDYFLVGRVTTASDLTRSPTSS